MLDVVIFHKKYRIIVYEGFQKFYRVRVDVLKDTVLQGFTPYAHVTFQSRRELAVPFEGV